MAHITVTTYKDMKVNDEVADIRDNILNNLNPELVNHSILNITPLYVAVHNNKLEITEALLAKRSKS